jgi:hypothetical protein
MRMVAEKALRSCWQKLRAQANRPRHQNMPELLHGADGGHYVIQIGAGHWLRLHFYLR